MPKPLQDLIEAFEGGDMGDVEFLELALEAGMDLPEIGAILEENRGEWDA
jgi:hypothetical protein